MNEMKNISGFKNKLQERSRHRRKRQASARTPETSWQRNDLAPELNLVRVPITDLKVSPRKTRKHSEAQIIDIAQSITALGFCAPILIGTDHQVLDGEARLEAVKMTGLVEVPCIEIGHLSAVEQRALRLAVNRLGEKAEWNLAELKFEMEELIVLDAPLFASGFTETEIDQIMLDDDATQIEVGPLEPDSKEEVEVKLGDVYQLGPHRLICGDATKAETFRALFSTNPTVQAQLVLTDVPYNVPISGHVSSGKHEEFVMASGEMSDAEFLAFNKAWIEASLAHLVDGGILGSFIDWRGLHTVHAAATEHKLAQLNLIIWAKANAGMGSLYRSQHELLPLYKKGRNPHVNNVELGKNGRYRSNVWNYPGASSLGSDARRGLKDHPTVKPTVMLQDAILDITRRGDIILDPFLGSGSTLVAAHNTGRICFGIELDPRYVDLIIRRFETATGEHAVLISNSNEESSS